MITRAELAEVVQLVRAVARTDIMPRFRTLRPGDISIKSGPLDLVTVADEAAETRIGIGLERIFPGCTVLGEEAVTRNPALLDSIPQAERCFVVDPIDGTYNFASGLPLFGVIVAIVEGGRTTGAIIYDPVGDDTAAALTGQGAWIERAGQADLPLRVAAPAPLGDMSGNVSWRFMPEPRRSHLCARLPSVAAAFDYRCSAHQYRLLAAGHCHFSIYHKLLPWDHAAGVLLHQEAGGYSSRLDGSAYDPADVSGGLICAPDRPSWHALRTALFAEQP